LTDLLRARLARREWSLTLEAVTPAADDAEARLRMLELADAMRADDRVAAMTLTDRTSAPDADPLLLAPAVTARSGKPALVHIAGKARTPPQVEEALRRAADAGLTNVLLTGGDVPPGALRVDALQMLSLARRAAPALHRVAVLAGAASDDAWRRASAKREAGADAFVAQASWDLAQRESIASWQDRLDAPVLGAVVALTRHTLQFLDAHGFTGLTVPASLRGRVEQQAIDAAVLRLALDLVLLRRLGYAGAHVSGLVTPRLVSRALDEASRLDGTVGDDWRDIWRDAMGIA
jgi:methylenetetrahydrofolate reductase (NADH)